VLKMKGSIFRLVAKKIPSTGLEENPIRNVAKKSNPKRSVGDTGHFFTTTGEKVLLRCSQSYI
jgi:hypothetical protein